MTSIIRKGNQISSDSLIFNGSHSAVHIQYKNKIMLNTAHTAAVLYVGKNYSDNTNKILNNVSNTIVNHELLNKEIDIKSFSEDDISFLKSLLDIYFVIFTKNKTYSFKYYTEDGLTLFSYDKDELVSFGTSSDFVTSRTDLHHLPVEEIQQQVIQRVNFCHGNINVFDLNLLKDLT